VPGGVHYAFQDEYGKRPFVRLPLRSVSVDVEQFGACVRAKVGEKFDDLEAITVGILDNPARQICSDLATTCLPDSMRQEIARCHRRAVIHPLAAIVDRKSDLSLRLFMSPNGFAEFLGAPKGSDLVRPDQLAEPYIQNCSNEPGLFEKLWKQGDTFVTSAWKHLIHRRSYRLSHN
jgi:hypothetical protein